MNNNGISLREQLIEKGITRLTIDGAKDFSFRLVAKECGVSCAAPFKHFKDKQEFFRVINEQLDDRLYVHLLAPFEGLERMTESEAKLELYIEKSVTYIEFLINYPFILDISFWKAIGDIGAKPMRQSKSLRYIIQLFNDYIADFQLSREEYDSVYFAMQNLTYGLPYMASASLLDPDVDYAEKMRRQMHWNLRNITIEKG